MRLYELLAGNIHGALQDIQVDWKRFLGLLMWHQLQPDTALPIVFHTYQQLLEDGRAPYPVPVYIDEGPLEEAVNLDAGEHLDLAYYLMLLHASGKDKFGALKTMFCAYALTYDPFDYHMIWHQRSVLEAVGAFSSNDLHVLDMGLVSQLLCLGQCHWAIYVVLHVHHRDDFPYLHATIIREILFQYCEAWCTQEEQHKFIEDLGVPAAWLHEAMAVYFNYHGELSKALEHFLACENWQKAHSIFATSVAHSLFLSAKHSGIWRLSTSMEDHKSEIEDWDLGAGIYISFYELKSSLQEDNDTMSEMDTLESKNDACRDLFGRLNESLAVWGSRLPVDARRSSYSSSCDSCIQRKGAVPSFIWEDRFWKCVLRIDFRGRCPSCGRSRRHAAEMERTFIAIKPGRVQVGLRLSEICCSAVSQFLMLAKSVISNANKAQDEDVDQDMLRMDWPEDSIEKAKIIRTRAQSMTGNVEAVCNSFITGIADVAEAYSAAIKGATADSQEVLPQKSIQEKADSFSENLHSDQTTAVGKIQDGLQYLTYVVLSTSTPVA